ncbi:MAG: beta-ketoacyl-[acyl-carrier-protein] synthase family protein [Phycisphaerales bacterium]
MRSHSVITGIGPVCSFGLGPEAFWESLKAGTHAVGPIESFDPSGFHTQIAGEVKDVKIRDFVPKSYRKATKVMARDTELAVVAAQLAADDAGLKTRGSEDDAEGFTIDPARVGCQIGAGLIAADTEELARAVATSKDEQGVFSLKKWGTEGEGEAGMNNLPPLWLLKYLPNMLACHVTIIHGLEGPSNTIMGAEASAILSIGESARVIERGNADICFTGGAESRINPLGLVRWEYAGRLAPASKDENPQDICRPYDSGSRGGLIGEAGGMLIIEDETHAKNRGATPYARIIGFGAAQTPRPYIPAASDIRRPDETERGLSVSIARALDEAGKSPSEVDAIFTLGLGQPTLDAMELSAIEESFAQREVLPPIVTIAHKCGNTMAAHSGLLCAGAALCLKSGELPQSIVTRGEAQGTPGTILVCSSSLGGQAGAIVLERCETK